MSDVVPKNRAIIQAKSDHAKAAGTEREAGFWQRLLAGERPTRAMGRHARSYGTRQRKWGGKA